jgi:hypothetical protein
MELTGKTFRAISNSRNGALNSETRMAFVSEDASGIVGVYGGGTIAHGSVVATRTGEDSLFMLYHCATVGGELRAGRAAATFNEGKHMHLDWEWLTGDRSAGTSEWILEL